MNGDNRLSPRGLVRRFKAAYICALSAIALLTFAAQVRNQQAIQSLETTGHVINLSGLQRALSQKCAKAALVAAAADDAVARSAALAELTADLATLRQTHQALIEGDPGLRLPPGDPETVRRLETLQPALDRLRAAADTLIATPPDTPLPGHEVQRLVEATAAFLPAMSQIVYQLDDQLAARHAGLRLTGWSLMAITLLVLLVEAVMIFEPTTRLLRSEFASGVRRERALRRARAAAEAANHSKTEFLANMSHEIRTPMTSILGYAETLLDERLDPVQRQDVSRTIMRNAQHLLTVLNDILDVSRMEAGKLTIERVTTRPTAILAEVESNLRSLADEKGLSLETVYSGPIPETIATDPTRLRQILMNLVGNALKFTSEGGARIAVSFRPGASPLLRIAIRDTGIGMTPDQCRRVFDPFEQADAGVARRFGGTGLGLSISRRLARELGGQITVASRPGEGSTFTLEIATGDLDDVRMIDPASDREPEQGAGTPVPPPSLVGRVLLAEDGEDNHRLIRRLLERTGVEVTWVSNGSEAVKAALAQSTAGTPFDLILMDMQMPVMDGYTATRKLRSAGYTNPIVALTAHAMRGDRQRCLQAGCDDYATKPIRRETFFRKLQRFLQAATPVGA